MGEDALDRMRKRPKSWVNLLIIVINIGMFLLVELTGGSDDLSHMIDFGAAVPSLIHEGEYYRLFTCMFLHFGIEHLFDNMLLLLFIGDYLEREVGKIRYVLIYFLGGLGASLASYGWNFYQGESVVSAGASGAIFAVIGAMIYIVIRHKGQMEELSLKRLLLMAVLTIYVGFTSVGIDNAAHIGGVLCGCVLAVLLYRKR